VDIHLIQANTRPCGWWVWVVPGAAPPVARGARCRPTAGHLGRSLRQSKNSGPAARGRRGRGGGVRDLDAKPQGVNPTATRPSSFNTSWVIFTSETTFLSALCVIRSPSYLGCSRTFLLVVGFTDLSHFGRDFGQNKAIVSVFNKSEGYFNVGVVLIFLARAVVLVTNFILV
jgi:hypothetical protein